MAPNNTIPELAITEHTVGQLMAELLTGEIPTPVWLKFKRTRHKVTAENKDGVCKGLLIALEIQSRDF